MKKTRLVYLLAITFLVVALVYTSTSKAASYDIKEDTPVSAVIASKVTVSADKVMDGITDITIDMWHNKTQQRIIMQCDATTQSTTFFYYMKDTLGSKARGATGVTLGAYNGTSKGMFHKGDAEIWDGSQTNLTLQAGLDKLKPLVTNDVGYLVFEFYEAVQGADNNPVAYSMLIPAKSISDIYKAIESIPGTDCNIAGGFTSVYSLKNLTNTVN